MFLFNILPSHQKEWSPKACPQFKRTKSISGCQNIKNADNTDGKKPTPSGRLAGVIGSERCIFAHSYLSQIHAVLKIRVSRLGISI